MRDLYFVIFRVDDREIRLEQRGPYSVFPDQRSLIDHLNIMRRGAYMMGASDEATKAGAEPRTISTVGKVATLGSGDVVFFAWSCELLAPDRPGCAVPKPGVVLVARRGDAYTQAWPPAGIDLPTLAVSLRGFADAMPDEPLSLARFFSGPAANADPITRFGRLEFISYASKDRQLAAEMAGLIEALGVSVFLAERSITPGELWSERIRAASFTGGRSMTLNSLTPGLTYSIQIRAFGSLGWSDWSDTVSRICT